MDATKWVARYLDHVSATGCEKPYTTRTSTKPRLVAFGRQFGDTDLMGINGETIVKWLSSLPCKVSTKHAYLRVLSAALNRSRRLGWEVPALGIKPKDLGRAVVEEQTPLTKEQDEQLIERAKTHSLGSAIMLARFAGLRLQEFLRLEWPDIDFEFDLIHVRAKPGWSPKNHQERSIPMHHVMKDFLTQRQQRTGPVVVKHNGQPYGRPPRTALVTLFKKLGIKGAWHVLRHTFCTRMLENGSDIYQVSKLMGHNDVAVTQRYAHTAARQFTTAAQSAY